jgi:hypothetical protein
VGFLVNSLFHETKIPMIDMKVQVCSKFRNHFFWKIVKSPLSMNFGRISTSKCKGKLQIMGVLYTHSPKSFSSFPKLPKILKLKKKIKFKKWEQPNRRRWKSVGRRSTLASVGLFPFFLKFFFFLPSTFCASGQLLLVGSSTCPPYPNFSLKLQTSISFDP